MELNIFVLPFSCSGRLRRYLTEPFLNTSNILSLEPERKRFYFHPCLSYCPFSASDRAWHLQHHNIPPQLEMDWRRSQERRNCLFTWMGSYADEKERGKKKSELWPLARDVSFLFLSLGNYKIMQPKSQSYNHRKPAKSLLQIQDDHLTPSFQPIIIPLTTWPTPRSCCFCNTGIPNPPPFLCLEVKISFSEESQSNSQWHACG